MKRPLRDKRPIGPFMNLEGTYLVDIVEIGEDEEDGELDLEDLDLGDGDIELDEAITFTNSLNVRNDVGVPSSIRDELDIEPGDKVIFTAVARDDRGRTVKVRYESKNLTQRNSLGLGKMSGNDIVNKANIETGDPVTIVIEEVRKAP